MKALKIAGIVIAVVALTATGVGIAAGGAAAAAAAGTAAATATSALAAAALTVASYASLAAGVLSVVSALAFKPKFSQQGTSTKFVTNPQSGLPYAFGRTRMSGLRIYAETNSRPGYTKFEDLLWFGVLLSAGAAIHSIESFKADGVPYTFNATTGQTTGSYANYMAQKVHLGGPQTSALALTLMSGSAPGWDSAHKLSGMTHAMWALRYNKEGDLYTAGVPEPSWIGKWVLAYDPRKDSTYPGGSGAHRSNDETTWEWTQNGPLHALTWAIGRHQNGKRTLGIGAPIGNIRVSDFVEAANVADANAWTCGGVEWSTDSKWEILKRMLQSGGAEPTMTGAMIGCRVNAPRVAIATIESYHLLDKLSISTTKPRQARFNTAIPRFRDEDSEWEVVSGTPVSIAAYVTADGGPRTKEIDLPLVQKFTGGNANQAAQLVAYEIVNSREAGPINFTTGPEWLGLKTGDVVNLNVPDEGLVNQPILIREVSLDPASTKVSFTAETETSAKHGFALGKTTTPPPPFSLTPPDLTPPAPNAALWTLSAASIGFGYPAIVVEGASEFPGADSVIMKYRIVGDPAWTDLPKVPATGTIRQIIMPVAANTNYEVSVAYQSEDRTGPATVLGPVMSGDDGMALLIDAARAEADGKSTTFIQGTAPTAAESNENDLWINTAQGNLTYRRVAGSGRLAIGTDTITLGGNYILLPWALAADQRIGQAVLDAAGAQATADGKVQQYTKFNASDPDPVAEGFGDLLYRVYLDPVQVDRWTGVAWAPIATYGATADQIADIGDALTAAFNAQATADGKVETFYETSMPTGTEGDLWFDVDDGNKLYRHNGSTFVAVQDDAIGDAVADAAAAISAAAGAQSTADGKVTTFIGETTPTAEGVGDLWYKASTKVLSRWSGSAWVATATSGAPSGTPVGSITADDVDTTIKTGGGVDTNQVDTNAIIANSLTGAPSAGPNSGTVTAAYLSKASITHTPYDANSVIIIFAASTVLAATTPSGQQLFARIRRDGTTDPYPATRIARGSAGAQPVGWTGIAKETGLTGSHTWSLDMAADVNATGGADPAEHSGTILFILELKK
ncbi:hypothetical protein BH10PSE12_BH10PSE12_02620 [soil metagenome]